MSAAEDCLLAYTPSGSTHEGIGVCPALRPQPAGSVLQKRLDSGLFKPALWVTRLAEAGDLRVIQGNVLWGPRFADLQRLGRPLSSTRPEPALPTM